MRLKSETYLERWAPHVSSGWLDVGSSGQPDRSCRPEIPTSEPFLPTTGRWKISPPVALTRQDAAVLPMRNGESSGDEIAILHPPGGESPLFSAIARSRDLGRLRAQRPGHRDGRGGRLMTAEQALARQPQIDVRVPDDVPRLNPHAARQLLAIVMEAHAERHPEPTGSRKDAA